MSVRERVHVSVHRHVCVYGVPSTSTITLDLTVSARVDPTALSAVTAHLLFRGLVMSS